MNLYLDDNQLDDHLAALLARDNHLVVRSRDIGMLGASDLQHLKHAVEQRLTVLTADADDFRELHDFVMTVGGTHHGIMTVHFDNDKRRDMKPMDIAAAIRKLEKAGIVMDNQLQVLNHWR